MNIVVSWILKFMRVSDPEIKVVTYDEANTFYILVHIMRNLQYRNIYDKNLSKTVEHLKLIEANLQGGFPDLFAHMLD
jgi:hypothetical protein